MKNKTVHGISYSPKKGLFATCGTKKINNGLCAGHNVVTNEKKVFDESELVNKVTCHNCLTFMDPKKARERARLMLDAKQKQYGFRGRPVGVKPAEKWANGGAKAEPPKIEPVVFPGAKDLLRGSVISDLIAGKTIVCELRVRVE